jgi:peptidoglycan/LPS O-acetylase OafA/YrhL
MLLLLPICFILIGVVLVELFKNIHFHGLMNNLNFMLGYTFFGRVFEFFSGIVLALILKKNTNFKFKYFTILGILGIVFSIYLLSILEQCPATDLLLFQQSLVNNLLLPVIGIVPFFYGLINEKTILHKLFSSDFFILLGKSSYVFYLIHIGFFRTIVVSFSTNYIFVFLSLNIIAIMLYLYVEKPLNRFFREQRSGF